MSYAKVPSAFVVLKEPTNERTSSVHGYGETIAQARQMVNAIVACQIGTIEREGDTGESSVAATPSASTGMFTDVILYLKKGTKRRSLRVNNFDITKTLSGGVVNAADSDVITLVDSYVDDENSDGYALLSGKVVA